LNRRQNNSLWMMTVMMTMMRWPNRISTLINRIITDRMSRKTIVS
jgi:hypothetical protein